MSVARAVVPAGSVLTFHGRCIDPGTLGFGVPFPSYVAAAAVGGFDLVEVPVSVLQELGPRGVRRILSQHELAATMFSCPWGMPANGCVRDDLFARRLMSIHRIFDRIAEAGGRLVSAFFACERPGMTKLSHLELVERCGALAARAAESGLRFCVELNDIGVLRQAARLAGDVEGLRLLFDTFHFFRAGLKRSWFDTLPPAAIGWVHLSDVPHGATPTLEGGPRAWPGAGCQDLAVIAAGLAANGYAGALSLEILPEPAAGTDYGRYAGELLTRTRAALRDAGVTWAAMDR